MNNRQSKTSPLTSHQIKQEVGKKSQNKPIPLPISPQTPLKPSQNTQNGLPTTQKRQKSKTYTKNDQKVQKPNFPSNPPLSTPLSTPTLTRLPPQLTQATIPYLQTHSKLPQLVTLTTTAHTTNKSNHSSTQTSPPTKYTGPKSTSSRTSTPISLILGQEGNQTRPKKSKSLKSDGNSRGPNNTSGDSSSISDDNFYEDFEGENDYVENDSQKNEKGFGKTVVLSPSTSHTGKFNLRGLGISNDFRADDGNTRDGVVVDIVKRKLLPQVNDNDVDALEITRSEFKRRVGFIVDEDLTNQLENVLTAEDLALLSVSKEKLTTKRQFDLTRGSPYAEHIRHLFPVDDFSGGIPQFTDIEIRAMFNRRPRFLNFVTENNPHGFDLSILHRLAAQTNIEKRNSLIKSHISHRYWHLKTDTVPKDQPKIKHRMHVHRTLNPRANVFKHHYLKPRTQMTKQERGKEKKTKRKKALEESDAIGFIGRKRLENGDIIWDENDDKKQNELKIEKLSELLLDENEDLYSQVKWIQGDISAKLREAGLTPEQIAQTRRFALNNGDKFLDTLSSSVGSDQFDPTLRSIANLRQGVHTKEDLSERRERLANVVGAFLANLSKPSRFSKVLISAEERSGAPIATSNEFRQQILDEVQRSGGLDGLADPKVVELEGILRQAMADPVEIKKIKHNQKKKAMAIAASKDKNNKKGKFKLDEDDLLL